MRKLTGKTMAVGLVAGLTLAAGAHAQMGQTKGMSHGGSTGTTGMTGMMGPMKMTGAVTMNGKPYTMQCGMTPLGRPKGMMGHGMAMMGKGGMGMMGKGGMGSMAMDKPMKMAGTMTMMGRTYRCTMMMTPQGK